MSFALVVVALALSGAKPPEPLQEILPQTQLIVDAVVVDVKTELPAALHKNEQPKQTVTLEVTRVVRGKLAAPPDKGPARITVVKPANGYSLKAGVKGPWLLHVDDKTGEMTVLGRYGPDTWTFDKIDAKLKELDPPQLR